MSNYMKLEKSEEERAFKRAVMRLRFKSGFNRPWKIILIVSYILTVAITALCYSESLSFNLDTFNFRALGTLVMDVVIGLVSLLILWGLVITLGTPFNAKKYQRGIRRLFKKTDSYYYPILLGRRHTDDKGIAVWEWENFGLHTNKWRDEEDNISATLRKPIAKIGEGTHAGRTLLYVARKKRPYTEILHWRDRT